MVKAKIPYGRYTKEFREEAVRMVIEGGFSSGSVAARLSLPKSTLENWVKAAERGKLGDIGKSHRPLTELEVELARVKRELAIAQMERDILKKAAAYFAKESLHGTRTLFSPSHVVSYFWGFLRVAIMHGVFEEPPGGRERISVWKWRSGRLTDAHARPMVRRGCKMTWPIMAW